MSLSHHNQQIKIAGRALPVSESRELVIIDLLLLPKEQLQNIVNRLDIIRIKCGNLIANCERIFYNNSEEDLLRFLARELPNYFLTEKSTSELSEYGDISRYSQVMRLFTDVTSIMQYKINQLSRVLNAIAVASSVEPIRYTKHTNERRGSAQKSDSSFVSYQWTGKKDSSLRDFFNILSDRYITNTTFAEFEAVFTEQPINLIKPIKWTGSPTELVYLILSMRSGAIGGDPEARMNWKKFKACFVKKDGNPFDEDLPSLKNKLGGIGSETRQILDNIIYEVS